MPIRVDDHDDTPHCEGKRWYIDDEDKLVKCIALLVIGYHNHVTKIIAGVARRSAAIDQGEFKTARRNLFVPNGSDISHRDGWLFQMISWIVLAERLGPNGHLDIPHPIPAQKGIDTLAIVLSSPKKPKVDRIIVGEEKATLNPRKTFHDEVLPDFLRIANGERNSEIRSRLSPLINGLDIDNQLKKSIIQQTTWAQNYCYRCCVTTNQSSLPTKTKLFNGFSGTLGTAKACIGELLILPDCRKCLDELARKILKFIKSTCVTP